NEEHKLHIKSVRFGSKNFNLEVYWYEGSSNEKDMNLRTQKMKNMEEIEGMTIHKKIIEWRDINERLNGIRYACEALEFLNKRVKYLTSYYKTHKYNEIVKCINHIISRFAEKRPQRYRLLDVRYHVMKNLILGDCNHLIHYLLFGFDIDLYLYIPK
ncbi:1264_t:CDS:2, partial [Funneliformis geosporum]